MKQIDFTPQWYTIRQQAKRDRKRRLAYVGTMAVLMVGWFAVNESRIQIARASLIDTADNHRQATVLSNQLQNMRDDKKALMQQQARFTSVSVVLPKRYVFAELAEVLPEDTLIRDFTLQVYEESEYYSIAKQRASSGLRFKDIKYSDYVAHFTVLAQEVESFVTVEENLRHSDLFEDIDSERPQQRQGWLEKKFIVYIYKAAHLGP